MDLKNKLIEECIEIILKNIFERISRKNIVSVILTGSAARNNAKYKEVNGNLYLGSDLDLLIVVSPKSLLKSLLIVKCLSKDITLQLQNKKSLSYVSLSISSEDSLKKSKPTIFYQDLYLNGKLIYGKNIKQKLVEYNIQEIPIIDFYRLIFNRMVEFLSAFVSNENTDESEIKNGLGNVEEQLGKLIFALIQALFFKEQGVILFNGFDLPPIKKDYRNTKQSSLLKELIEKYNDFTISKFNETYIEKINKKNWDEIIKQVQLTLESLSSTKDSSPKSIKRLFKQKMSGICRLRSSSIFFLQSVKIYKISELLRAIYYNIRFGQDHVYIPLYTLFLSIPTILNNESAFLENKSLSNKQNQSSLSNEKIAKDWLKSFFKFYVMWKIYGGF